MAVCEIVNHTFRPSRLGLQLSEVSKIFKCVARIDYTMKRLS